MTLRRLAATAVLALIVAFSFGVDLSGPAGAAQPAGVVVLFDSNRTGNLEIYLVRDGGSPQQLTSDTRFDSFWPKLSPDGRSVLFHRSPRGTRDRELAKVSTWAMGIGGQAPKVLLPVGAHGWGLQGHAEWAPDGKTIALIGGSPSNAQVFIVAADGSSPRRLTRDAVGGPRPGNNIDPSWAPDGRSLLFVGCPAAMCLESQYEVYRVGLDGLGEVRLTTDSVADYDPYWAPNGSAIAWLRNTGTLVRWGIYRMGPNGGSPIAVIDDGGINSKPEWSPDSTEIYFHRSPPLFGGSSGFNVWRIRPDGTGLTRVLPDHGGAYDNEFPEAGATGDTVTTTLPPTTTATSTTTTTVATTTTTTKSRPRTTRPSATGLASSADSPTITTALSLETLTSAIASSSDTTGVAPPGDSALAVPISASEHSVDGRLLVVALLLLAVAGSLSVRAVRRR